MWIRVWVWVWVMVVMGNAAPQVGLPAQHTPTTHTEHTTTTRLGTRQRFLVRPSSRESIEDSGFPPPLPQGAKSGQVLLQPASTESLETNLQQGHGGGGGIEVDSLESSAYSLAVALGNSVPSAARTPEGGHISRSSQFLVFGDDDNSLDLLDSIEDDDDDDDDDFRFMTLGRRYHPDGVAPLAPKDLFIPPVSPLPASPAAIQKSFTNPFLYNLADSAEDDESGEDLSDVHYEYNIPHSAVAFVQGDTSSEERIQLDETLLNERYSYVDRQGSSRWGYTQKDQYQHQVVRQDGTMEGSFGWTAPNGHHVSIEYVADEGGYRVLSSHGTHIKNTKDVQQLNQEHARAHQERVSGTHTTTGSLGPEYSIHSTYGGGGVPLPTPTGPATGPVGGSGSGVPLPTFGSGASGVEGTYSG
ncbi:hypothetical protein Pcinc_038208, partial [Petrolisthes cinctipes]